MLLTTRGLILRTVKYSETSVICDIFTEAQGVQTYIISGVRQSKSQSGGIVRPMMWVEFVAYQQEGKEMHRVREIKLAMAYRRLPFEVVRSSLGLFITEILQKTLREKVADLPLFEFLWDVYQWLDTAERGLANIHLLFLVQFSEYLGFMPDDTYFPESWFDYADGGFLAQPPLHRYYFDQVSTRILHDLLGMQRGEEQALAISPQERRDFLKNMLHFYQYHIDNFPIIHSHSVLQTILS